MWIEIFEKFKNLHNQNVTSHTEVWIEIKAVVPVIPRFSWVTSHTEVWIEIINSSPAHTLKKVTSHTEVWIEIRVDITLSIYCYRSPPIRRCGLK